MSLRRLKVLRSSLIVFFSLPVEIVAALRRLHDHNSSTLLPRVISVAEMELTQEDLGVYSGLISAWYSILRLNKWLETTGEPGTIEPAVILIIVPYLFFFFALRPAIPLLGQNLMSRVLSSRTAENLSPCSELNEVGVVTFAVLLQELEIRPASEHALQLDLIVAVYIALSDTLSPTSTLSWPSLSFTKFIYDVGLTVMDAHLGKACKKVTLEDYTHLLSFVSESLEDLKHIPAGRLLHLVRLAALLLREHPSRQCS